MSHTEAIERLRRAVLETPGTTDPELRRRAYDGSPGDDPLEAYARRVRDDWNRITDQSIRDLMAAGFSEDQILEVTLAAALGAADLRLRAGLRALGAGS